MKLLRNFMAVQEGAQLGPPDCISVVSYNLLAQKYVDAGGCALLGLLFGSLLLNQTPPPPAGTAIATQSISDGAADGPESGTSCSTGAQISCVSKRCSASSAVCLSDLVSDGAAQLTCRCSKTPSRQTWSPCSSGRDYRLDRSPPQPLKH